MWAACLTSATKPYNWDPQKPDGPGVDQKDCDVYGKCPPLTGQTGVGYPQPDPKSTDNIFDKTCTTNGIIGVAAGRNPCFVHGPIRNVGSCSTGTYMNGQESRASDGTVSYNNNIDLTHPIDFNTGQPIFECRRQIWAQLAASGDMSEPTQIMVKAPPGSKKQAIAALPIAGHGVLDGLCGNLALVKTTAGLYINMQTGVRSFSLELGGGGTDGSPTCQVPDVAAVMWEDVFDIKGTANTVTFAGGKTKTFDNQCSTIMSPGPPSPGPPACPDGTKEKLVTNEAYCKSVNKLPGVCKCSK